MEEKDKEIAALKDKVSQREADVRTAEGKLAEDRKSLETERAAKLAIERELDKTRTDLVAATERATKAEAEVVARDVKALVGVKITTAEVDDMTELATSNRKLFDSLMEKRAPLNLSGRVVLPSVEDSGSGEQRGAQDADSEIAEMAKKGA